MRLRARTIISSIISKALIVALLPLAAVVSLSGADAEAEFRELLRADEDALEQIDRLMSSNAAFAREGAGLNQSLIATKVRTLSDPVIEKYETFLKRHPGHVKGHLAFASFLGEFGLSEKARRHLDEALRLAPDDPVALNNVANYYGEHGPATKAFEMYEKAIALRPNESTYYRNCASVILLYRPEARLFYQLPDEQAVFAKALALYRRARSLKPDDFLLASQLAQTLYHIRPFPYREAVEAWEATLKLARNPAEREGVLIHLARVHIREKKFDAARACLDGVRLPELQQTRKQLLADMPREMRPVSPGPASLGPKLFNSSTAPPPGRQP